MDDREVDGAGLGLLENSLLHVGHWKPLALRDVFASAGKTSTEVAGCGREPSDPRE